MAVCIPTVGLSLECGKLNVQLLTRRTQNDTASRNFYTLNEKLIYFAEAVFCTIYSAVSVSCKTLVVRLQKMKIKEITWAFVSNSNNV